jgi:PKHD-type hydroxylase
MNIKPFYVYQKAAFPADFCAKVIEEGEKLPRRTGDSLGFGESARDDVKIRSTERGFFPQTPEFSWLYDHVLQFVNAANQKYWKFRISRPEFFQYGVYNPGQFYSWHVDQHSEPYKEPSVVAGLTRKLSITIQLDDGNDYDGGDFEMREPSDYEKVQRIDGIRARGSLIVFPSFVMHRVTPVTKGIRRSLVGWIVGPPFV